MKSNHLDEYIITLYPQVNQIENLLQSLSEIGTFKEGV